MRNGVIIIGIALLSALESAASGVKITPIDSTPHEADVQIDFHTENAILTRNQPLCFQIRSYPLGVSTYAPSLTGMRQNPFGTTLLLIFNGEHRLHLRKIDHNPLAKPSQPFEKEFRKFLTTKLAKHLKEGKNVVTAVACNSYGESLKLPAVVCTKIVDYGKRVPRDTSLEDKLNQPYVLYNAPTGHYSKGEGILLDFITMNTCLSPNGDRITLKMDGEEVAEITSNTAYRIDHLPCGQHTIELILINQEGQAYPHPFCSQKETIIVEPMIE